MNGTFVSQKINKVRWRPQQASSNILTGSWDDTNNSINLWKVNEDEDDYGSPTELDKVVVNDDVTQLKFVDYSTFIVSTSGGDIDLYIIIENYQCGKLQIGYQKGLVAAHTFLSGRRCPCTDFAHFENNLVSVGEDGKLNIIDFSLFKLTRTIDDADSCTLRAISFYTENVAVTGNNRGQMKIWDIRGSDTNKPESSFMLLGPPIGCTTIIQHPSQKHILLSGLEDGAISVWDLRHTTSPITLLDAHSKSVTEIAFHPEHPGHFFSSSISGELWHWDTTKTSQHQLNDLTLATISNQTDIINDRSSSWMAEGMKNKATVFSLVRDFPFSINSFDIYNDNIIYSSDNEAVYIIKDICK